MPAAFAQVRQAVNRIDLPCRLINTHSPAKDVDMFFDNRPMRPRVQNYQFEATRENPGVSARRALIFV